MSFRYKSSFSGMQPQFLWKAQYTIISSSLLLLTHTSIFHSVLSKTMNLLAQKTFPCIDPVSLCYQSVHLSEPVSGNHNTFLLKWLLFQTLHLPLKQNNFVMAVFRWSRMVSKKLKMKLYWSIIRPIVTYACETWVLKETIKNKLNGIWKESAKKDLWSYKRKRWYMEDQNKSWIRSINHLTPNGHYMGRTAQLTSRCCILYIYSTNIRTEYFKYAA